MGTSCPEELGLVKEKVLSWLPSFEMYVGGSYIGRISKESTFFKPKFNIECNGYRVEGDRMEWDHRIHDPYGRCVAEPKDALCADAGAGHRCGEMLQGST